MKICWISTLPLTPAGGGAFAANYHAYHALGEHHEVRHPGPVGEVPDRIAEFVSKIQRRILHRPGRFAQFSELRLDHSARRVAELLEEKDEIAFFRAVTPWIRWKPDRPYACYCDVGFRIFYENTFRPGSFQADDLERIWDAEAEFLEGAEAVFFESQWGLDRTKTSYGVSGKNFVCAGRGGNVPIPDEDTWEKNSLRLVTSAKHFRQKGGDLVADAFEILRKDNPEMKWSILGGEPDFDWRSREGVVYEGFLDPTKSEDRQRMSEILAQSFLLLHPTREDINPLVVTEAAYFGCPTISVRKFALPELVLDGETGLLLDPPVSGHDLAEAVRTLIEDRQRYETMRKEAREFALQTSTWPLVGERMKKALEEIQPQVPSKDVLIH